MERCRSGSGTARCNGRGAAWLRHWLFPGQHLLAAATRSYELGTSSTVGGYGLILIAFPVIGLALGSLSSLAATESLTAAETGLDGPAAVPAGTE